MKALCLVRAAILITFAVIPFLSYLCYARTWQVPSEVPTIPDAADSATYGDTILVAAGTYVCPDNLDYSSGWVVLQNGVSLIGQGGADSTIIIDLSTNPTHYLVILRDVSHCLVKGFAFVREVPKPGNFHGVYLCRSSDSSVNSCRFKGFLYGIKVYGLSEHSLTPTISHCYFTRCGAGAYCSDTEALDSPLVRFNTFVDNDWGIRCFDAAPYIADNSISDSYWAGVYCYGRSPATLDRNLIVRSQYYGLWVDTEAFYEPYLTTAWLPTNGNSIYSNSVHDLYNGVEDQRGEVEARYTYWGSDCPDFDVVIGGPGRVNYTPWCDSAHTQAFDECPPQAKSPTTWGSLKGLFR